MERVDLSAYHNAARVDLPRDKDALRGQMMQTLSEASQPKPDDGAVHPDHPADAGLDNMSVGDIIAEVLEKKVEQEKVSREVMEGLANRVQAEDSSIRLLEEMICG